MEVQDEPVPDGWGVLGSLPPTLYQQVVQALPDALLVVDAVATIQLANAQAAALFGYPVAELLGAPIERLVPEADRAVHAAHRAVYQWTPRRRLMSTSQTFTAQRRDGTLVAVEIGLGPLADGPRTLVVVSVRDVGERARLAAERERLLAQAATAESRLRTLFQHMSDTVFVTDAAGHLVGANRAAEVLLGYSHAELLALPVADLFGDQAAGAAALAELERSGAWQGEIELRRKDGSAVPVEGTSALVPTPEGPLYVCIDRDISARQAREAEQRDFLAMVTHDLKAPVTGIRAQAELLRRRAAYRPESIDAIIGQADRLSRMIDDLLEVTRLAAGQVHLEPGTTELVTLVRQAVTMSQVLTAHHQLSLVAPTEPVIGCWDADRLGQVLTNLLDNAIKYSPDGGTIVVTVTVAPEQVQMTVADQGIGLAPAELEQIFERFYRTDAAIGRARGLGLGLAICRALVEAHGGQLAASSPGPGRGSTFTLTLPH